MPWIARVSLIVCLLPAVTGAQRTSCARPLTSADSLDTVVHLAVQPNDFGYLPGERQQSNKDVKRALSLFMQEYRHALRLPSVVVIAPVERFEDVELLAKSGARRASRAVRAPIAVFSFVLTPGGQVKDLRQHFSSGDRNLDSALASALLEADRTGVLTDIAPGGGLLLSLRTTTIPEDADFSLALFRARLPLYRVREPSPWPPRAISRRDIRLADSLPAPRVQFRVRLDTLGEPDSTTFEEGPDGSHEANVAQLGLLARKPTRPPTLNGCTVPFTVAVDFSPRN